MAIKLERPKQVEALRHLLVRILTLCLLTGAASGLRCYQCFSTDLEPCQPEDLQECPRHLFYNRCATRYRQIDSGEMYVRRECSTGCSDGYDVWNHGLNVRLSAHSRHFPIADFCDRSSPEFECKVCCQGDGCNYSKTVSRSPSPSAIMPLLVLTIGVSNWSRL